MKSVTSLIYGSSLPVLEAELLLAHLLEKDRSYLLAHGEEILSLDQVQSFQKLVERRKKREPIAYLLGEKEFYGRSFCVTPDVLIPRPATEILIEDVLDIFRSSQQAPLYKKTEADTGIIILQSIQPNTPPPSFVLDVGTGSGCIAITLACELPNLRCIASDISEEALLIAKKNAAKHHVTDRVCCVKADLIPAELPEGNFLLISNPPYIPMEEELMPDVRNFEPSLALFGGKDGTDVIRRIVQAAEENPSCIGWVMEMKEEQAENIRHAEEVEPAILRDAHRFAPSSSG